MENCDYLSSGIFPKKGYNDKGPEASEDDPNPLMPSHAVPKALPDSPYHYNLSRPAIPPAAKPRRMAKRDRLASA